MKAIKVVFLISITYLYILNSVNSASATCSCPSSNTPPQVPTDYSGTPTDETISGKNYGKPTAVGKQVYLQADFIGNKGISTIKDECPNGYKMPTLEQIQTLLVTFKDAAEAYTILKDSTKFNAKPDFNYVLNTKSNALTDGSQADAWLWKSLYLDSKNSTAYITDIQTYFNTDKLKSKCIQNPTLSVSVYSNDFYKDVSYPAKISTPNTATPLWKFSDIVKSEVDTKLSSSSIGCKYLQVWTKNIANEVLYFCKPVTVIAFYGSDGETTLTSATIKSVDPAVKANGTSGVHFSKGSAPIAPKLLGGLYMLYSESGTNSLKVLEFDKDMKKLSDNDLNIKGYPMDIVETSMGIFIYALDSVDSNNSFIAGYSATYTQQFKRNVMNNGKSPVSISDQISFFDKDGKINFGMETMYTPHNGKLSYGKGKVSLIFAHYNYFGVNNAHTGDTQMTFNEEGKDEHLGWSWGASHSLIQANMYDGNYFVSASLGDQYPKNIKVCFVDPNKQTSSVDKTRGGTFTNVSVCKDILTDEGINGTGSGKACGRLGGLVKFGNQYSVVYARNPCTVKDYVGVTTSSKKDEIGLVTWNWDGSAFSNIKITSFVPKGSNVVGLRAGRYGQYIAVGYATSATDAADAPVTDSFTGKTEKANYILVDFNGKVISNSFQATEFSIPQSDAMRILLNGSLSWGFVDSSGNLKLYYTETPPFKMISDTTATVVDGSTLSSGGVITTNSHYLCSSISLLSMFVVMISLLFC